MVVANRLVSEVFAAGNDDVWDMDAGVAEAEFAKTLDNDEVDGAAADVTNGDDCDIKVAGEGTADVAEEDGVAAVE